MGTDAKYGPRAILEPIPEKSVGKQSWIGSKLFVAVYLVAFQFVLWDIQHSVDECRTPLTAL